MSYTENMKPLLVLVVFALFSGLSAQPIISNVELQGGVVGENKFELKAGDAFTSETTLTLAGTKVSSVCVGKFGPDGKIAELDLTEKQGAREARAAWKSGKLNAWNNGKHDAKDVALVWDGVAFLHPFHPRLGSGLLKAHQAGGGKPIRYLMGQGFAVLEAPVTVANQTASVERGNVPVKMLEVSVTGIALRLAYDVSGTVRGFHVPAQSFSIVEKGYSGIFVDPISRFPELPKPTHKTKTETGLKMTTPDGATLVADLVRPAEEGRYPVILMRTPYGRANMAAIAATYVRRGYAVVAQDVRGMGESTGAWDPLVFEVADGKATLDWLVQQPWCDGNIGMIGGSYGGLVQWAAAVNHHPALKCIIPQVSPPDPVHNFPWDHGAFLLFGNVWWSRIVAQKEANFDEIGAGIGDLRKYAKLPLNKVDDSVLGKDVPFYNEWIKRDTLEEWPTMYRLDQVAGVKIPVLHVSGFWDGDGIGTKLHWEALRKSGGNQWLVFGPWEHGFNLRSEVGGVKYGNQAVIDLDSVYLRFFETYLKQRQAKMEEQPRVRIFVSGMNQWMHGSDWPLPFTKRTTWYLGGGDARGKASKGTLGLRPSDHAPDSYDYDPMRIGRQDKAGGPGSLVVKSSFLNSGTLTYTSSEFEKRTLIAGPIEADLCISTTAKDATFHAMLWDKRPDGRLELLGLPGTQRLTYLKGKFEPLTPNKVYRFQIRLWDFAHTMEPGHRLVLMVTSDMYPKFARNPGTGEPDEVATRMVRARHTLYKARGMSSRFSAQTYSW